MINKLIVEIEKSTGSAAYHIALFKKNPDGDPIRICTLYMNNTITSCGIYSINEVENAMKRLFDVFGEKQVLNNAKKIFIKIIKKLAQRQYHGRLPAFVFLSVVADKKYRHHYLSESNRQMDVIAKAINEISTVSAIPQINPNTGNTISFNILAIEDLFKKK